jgi:hypothetical protein
VLNDARPHVTVTLPAISRRGKPFECRVNVTPLHAFESMETSGVILIMEDVAATP